MIIKKNNHLLTRMIIKRWKENNGLIYEKSVNKSREIVYKDYSKEYYYSLGAIDDKLENEISAFETYISKILVQLNKEITNKKIILNIQDYYILKLYAYLQCCRNDNSSPVIKEDETGIYSNNKHLFGVPLIKTPDEAVKITQEICDEFKKIKQSDSNKVEESLFTKSTHLVIVYNNTNSFIISESTAIIECTIDSNYCIAFTPVSPKIGLILADSNYFYDITRVRYIKHINSDEYISMVLDDNKLLFNGIIKGDKICINYVELSNEEIQSLNSILYEDGNNILYSDIEALINAKKQNPARKIVFTLQ